MAELLAEDRKDFMKLFLIILGINILIFLIVFVFCACKVASLCDKEMEKIIGKAMLNKLGFYEIAIEKLNMTRKKIA